MKYQVLGLSSNLMNGEEREKISSQFINDLEVGTGISMEWVLDPQEFSEDAVPLIFIQTGGTEGKFLELFDQMPKPTLLLTHGAMNSLAASLEILSYLHQRGSKGEVIHGEQEYIKTRLINLQKIIKARSALSKAHLGVIGNPSDWLIASQVHKETAKKKLGCEIIDIPIGELIQLSAKDYIGEDPLIEQLRHKPFAPKELQKALNIYGALRTIKDQYELTGLTVRCFDLLAPLQSTGCIGLALLNALGIPSACEGDVAALISMMILQLLLGEPGFMVNPARINVKQNCMVVAHCTLPLNMGGDYQLTTHYESGIGVAVDGHLPEGKAMIFKVDASLERYFLSEIEIVANFSERNLCRTQIEIKLKEDVGYFLNEPCGNHHIVTLEHNPSLIHDFMESLKSGDFMS